MKTDYFYHLSSFLLPFSPCLSLDLLMEFTPPASQSPRLPFLRETLSLFLMHHLAGWAGEGGGGQGLGGGTSCGYSVPVPYFPF